MREWDEMIARQVSADGVRTTWGEHIPAAPVETTDDRILSAERVAADLLTIRIESPHGVPVNVEWVEELVASHEALRARLSAAEREASKYRTEAHILTTERDRAWDHKCAAEERAEQAIKERDGLREVVASWQHIANEREVERDDAELADERSRSKLAAAEAQVAALTEALRGANELLREAAWLHGMIEHPPPEMTAADPPECPSGCGCRYFEDPDRRDCACDGPCCMDEGWWLLPDGSRRPAHPPVAPEPEPS